MSPFLFWIFAVFTVTFGAAVVLNRNPVASALSLVVSFLGLSALFMGTIGEQWQKLPDLTPALRVPITLLVAALLCVGFFPQSLVQMVASTFRTHLSANR